MKRHICNCCKRKLYERDMEQTNRQTRYGKDIWICARCLMEGRTIDVY